MQLSEGAFYFNDKNFFNEKIWGFFGFQKLRSGIPLVPEIKKKKKVPLNQNTTHISNLAIKDRKKCFEYLVHQGAKNEFFDHFYLGQVP